MKIDFTQNEISIILSALFRMPYGKVAELIDKISKHLEQKNERIRELFEMILEHSKKEENN